MWVIRNESYEAKEVNLEANPLGDKPIGKASLITISDLRGLDFHTSYRNLKASEIPGQENGGSLAELNQANDSKGNCVILVGGFLVFSFGRFVSVVNAQTLEPLERGNADTSNASKIEYDKVFNKVLPKPRTYPMSDGNVEQLVPIGTSMVLVKVKIGANFKLLLIDLASDIMIDALPILFRSYYEIYLVNGSFNNNQIFPFGLLSYCSLSWQFNSLFISIVGKSLTADPKDAINITFTGRLTFDSRLLEKGFSWYISGVPELSRFTIKNQNGAGVSEHKYVQPLNVLSTIPITSSGITGHSFTTKLLFVSSSSFRNQYCFTEANELKTYRIESNGTLALSYTVASGYAGIYNAQPIVAVDSNAEIEVLYLYKSGVCKQYKHSIVDGTISGTKSFTSTVLDCTAMAVNKALKCLIITNRTQFSTILTLGFDAETIYHHKAPELNIPSNFPTVLKPNLGFSDSPSQLTVLEGTGFFAYSGVKSSLGFGGIKLGKLTGCMEYTGLNTVDQSQSGIINYVIGAVTDGTNLWYCLLKRNNQVAVVQLPLPKGVTFYNSQTEQSGSADFYTEYGDTIEVKSIELFCDNTTQIGNDWAFEGAFHETLTKVKMPIGFSKDVKPNSKSVKVVLSNTLPFNRSAQFKFKLEALTELNAKLIF